MPQLQLAGGISIQHGSWDLCVVWSARPLSSTVGGTSVLHGCGAHIKPRPPYPRAGKKDDENSKVRQDSPRAFDVLTLAGRPRLCHIAADSDLALLI